MSQLLDDGSVEIIITATVEGFDAARTLAEAVLLLRYYAATYGDTDAVETAERAAQALREIEIDVDA